MKTMFVIIHLILISANSRAQDTLLVLKKETFDINQNPLNSWVYEYDETGNEISFLQINFPRRGDTICNRNFFVEGKLKYCIYNSTHFREHPDTTFYHYNGNTTIISSRGENYELVYKLNLEGLLFFRSTKTLDPFFKHTEYTVDSIFHDSANNTIHTLTYKMNESLNTTSNPIIQRDALSGSWIKKTDPKRIEVGSVLKEKWEFKNEKSQLVKEVESNYLGGNIKMKCVEYDQNGRFLKSDQYFEHDTIHWIEYAKYDTINDKIQVKTWNNNSLGYKINLTPLKSNQQDASISYFYGPEDELISAAFNKFNKEGYIIESKFFWYDSRTPINTAEFETIETTFYTYVTIPISKFNKK